MTAAAHEQQNFDLPSAVQRVPSLAGEMMAEFFGTMILILFGVGVVAQVVAADIGNHDSIAWAWGLGVMLGIYVAGRISGAHINPAVTLALAMFQGFPWRKVAPYASAQVAGAFAILPRPRDEIQLAVAGRLEHRRQPVLRGVRRARSCDVEPTVREGVAELRGAAARL